MPYVLPYRTAVPPETWAAVDKCCRVCRPFRLPRRLERNRVEPLGRSVSGQSDRHLPRPRRDPENHRHPLPAPPPPRLKLSQPLRGCLQGLWNTPVGC
ncbi:hypothetical protein DPEC_G00321260 [Dallia pectoralis]|uniref:Uncharacterized protein n=1 Tax=Dallia pectoralis TaxID=75939 RepID=A0ACC2FA29_DALPE|nr:hypothetical protein DPEC_G00321260 [Dallia pectoralis]